MSIEPNTTTLNTSNQTTTEQHTTNITQTKYDVINNIKITTHNVQGINDKLKLQLFLEHCYKKNYTIISMTKTKLAESTYTKLKLVNPYYEVYTSNCTSDVAKKQESSMGTAIAILKFMQPYIHNIQILAGTAILIDLFLPQNQKIRIISVYLTPNNKILNNKTQQEIIS